MKKTPTFKLGDRVAWVATLRWDYKKEGVAGERITGVVQEIFDIREAREYLGGTSLKVLPDHRKRPGPFQGVCTYVMARIAEHIK